MELVSGFVLWMLDIFGIKTIRKESNIYKKILKTVALLIVGFIGIVLYFTAFGPPK